MTPRSAGLMVDTGSADNLIDNTGNTVTFPLRAGNPVMLRMSPRDTMVKIHAPTGSTVQLFAADYPPWSGVKREKTTPNAGMCVYPPASSMRSPPIAPSTELDSSFYSMVGFILARKSDHPRQFRQPKIGGQLLWTQPSANVACAFRFALG